MNIFILVDRYFEVRGGKMRTNLNNGWNVH